MRLALLSFVLVLSACGETKAVTGNDVVEVAPEDGGGDDDGNAGDTIDGDDDGGDDDGGDDDGGDDDGGDDDGGDDDVDDVVFDLVLALDTDTSVAGESVTFSVRWDGDDGSTAAVTAYEMASDMEDAIAVDEASITATVAGVHTLTATATNPEGDAVEATASLSVDAGPATVLNLELSASEMVAGESLIATVSAQDAFGNETAGEDATLSSPEGVSIDGDTLSATAAGSYTITATLGDLTTEASFSVIAGEAITVDLVLEDTNIELGDDTDYEVFALDAYGNPTRAGDIRVWADEGVTIDEDREELIFNEEGIFNCYAEIIDTEIIDIETILIDSTGPDLEVFTPERGDWGTETETVLSGEANDTWSGPASVTVNGFDVTVDDDGGFASTMGLDFGINTFETTASDTDLDEDGTGNQSTDIRSVLQATEFWDPNIDMEDGLLVRMWEGEGGLGQLESMADGLTDSIDLDTLIEGEIFTSSDCVWFLFFPVC